MTRRTLNGLQPRTLHDAARDPMDWWQPPSHDDAVRQAGARGDRTIVRVAVFVTCCWLAAVLAQRVATLVAGAA